MFSPQNQFTDMGRRVILFLMWTFLRVLPVALICAVLTASGAALALDSEVLNSVVRLKPDWPLQQRGRDASGAPRDPQGTGVVVAPGGYIATNVHVIGEAEKVDVMLEDGRILAADIVGRDPVTDIALLKIDADLPVLERADTPRLADPVCTIGNQFGIGLSVTCGVVSALSRSGMGFNPVEDFIQTDASVNPGGSGGALVDRTGRLVGMVSAIFTKQSDADIGVNFATSVPLLMRVVDDLRMHGRVVRGMTGFRAGSLPPGMAGRQSGVMIEKVTLDGPAFAAGLGAGDILTHVDGERVMTLSGLEAQLFMKRPGETLTVSYNRGKETRTADIVMGGQ